LRREVSGGPCPRVPNTFWLWISLSYFRKKKTK